MKKTFLAVPVLLAAALTGCDKNNSAPHHGNWDTPDANSTNSSDATNSNSTGALNEAEANGNAATNVSAQTALSTPEIAPTAPISKSKSKSKSAKSKTQVIEMPTTVPTAPTNFYSGDFATNHCYQISEDYSFTVRAGFQHVNYGNSRDTWYAAVKFSLQSNQLRADAGKNAWLVPDAEAEFSHDYLPRPNTSAAGEGVQFDATFFWPWINWTTHSLARENCACFYAQPMKFSFGPVAELGFEKTFDGSHARFARYGGARLTLNRYAFLQYTFGVTDGFSPRQDILGELPFYVSHDAKVRYVLRGEWNRTDQNLPDYYQIGLFAEMPLGIFIHPREWRDLVPFAN